MNSESSNHNKFHHVIYQEKNDQVYVSIFVGLVGNTIYEIRHIRELNWVKAYCGNQLIFYQISTTKQVLKDKSQFIKKAHALLEAIMIEHLRQILIKQWK